jgi:hypothetical protein
MGWLYWALVGLNGVVLTATAGVMVWLLLF